MNSDNVALEFKFLQNSFTPYEILSSEEYKSYFRKFAQK